MANPHSLFSTALRSFFSVLLGVLGFGVALLILLWGFSWLNEAEGSQAIKPELSYEILPNLDDARLPIEANAPIVLQIDIHGMIGSEELSSDSIQKQLLESREGFFEDHPVKALFLNINSPGGTIFASDAIYRAIKDYKERFHVPVYAFVDGLCASGGLYIACAADRIYATDVSIIGSVGVIGFFFNVSDLLNKVGVSSLTLTAGKDKDELNPFRPWKANESSHMQEIIENDYERFVAIVTASRTKLTADSLKNSYGAHVYPALQAAEFGFIDEVVKSRQEALAALLQAANLSPSQPYQVGRLKRGCHLLSFFSDNCLFQKGRIEHELLLPGGVDVNMVNQPLCLYLPSE